MNKITDFGLSNDNIKSIASAETKISGLKEVNKENTSSINESKVHEQYVPFIVHSAKFPRTKSGNVAKAVTSAMYDDLINHCGMNKSSAKLLKETSIKFCEFFDVPTQATPELVRGILADNNLEKQNDIVAMVSGKKEVTLAEKIAKMVYGKEVTKKVDGVEQTIFIPTDLSMDDIQDIEDHMADIKRVRIATDEANQAKLAETNEDNQETNEVLDALVG
jgi:hypothetical protein|tara:strand:- start:45 stop:704 length:660 start_codon:yes stop_codon:yes gene_type:complete